MDDMAWQKALEHYSKAFDEAEPFNKWHPPDNTYTTMISNIKRGVKDKDGIPYMYWEFMTKIIAPDLPKLDGREFQLAFLPCDRLAAIKTICNQISQDTRKRKIEEYDKEIDGYVGICLMVRVHRETSNKGNPYVAKDITEILTQEAVIPAEEQETPA